MYILQIYTLHNNNYIDMNIMERESQLLINSNKVIIIQIKMIILDNKYQKVHYNLPCTNGASLSLTELVGLPQTTTLRTTCTWHISLLVSNMD